MCQINGTDDCKKLCNRLLLGAKWTIRRDNYVIIQVGPQRSGVCRLIQ
ncbi:hypothetical protein F-S17_0211 [Faustovirus]|nr:hypothetical protein F-LCD7_0227 [Faustovirus]QJX71988.1 hypothetical protein F-M6_0225 [Faustovirus]QJX72477.1 hypothetical protein F-S17_0211 [Faustovirus]